jgi:putative flippase GtrA
VSGSTTRSMSSPNRIATRPNGGLRAGPAAQPGAVIAGLAGCGLVVTYLLAVQTRTGQVLGVRAMWRFSNLRLLVTEVPARNHSRSSGHVIPFEPFGCSQVMAFSQVGDSFAGQDRRVLLTSPRPPAVRPSRDLTPPTRSRRVVVAQLASFAAIGAVVTLAYLAMYATLRGTLGMQGANVVAWVATAVADTSANRRLTFGVRGQAGAARAQAESLLVFGTGMLITSGALLVLGAIVASPGQAVQLAVLAVANLLAGLLRFLLLRYWVFAPTRPKRRIGEASGR